MTKHYTANYRNKSKTGVMQFARVNVPDEYAVPDAERDIKRKFPKLELSDFKEVVVAGKVVDDQGEVVRAAPAIVAEVKPGAQLLKS